MDDGSELRYDDEDEDIGQPLVLYRMWGAKVVPLRRVKDKEKRYGMLLAVARAVAVPPPLLLLTQVCPALGVFAPLHGDAEGA